MSISIDYYQKVFRNDPDKISTFTKILIEDFKKVELDFFNAAENGDIKLMRRNLHSISPIVSNLRFKEMLDIMDQYKDFDEYRPELSLLNDKLRSCFKSVYDFFPERPESDTLTYF